jgi:hypothetical protein
MAVVSAATRAAATGNPVTPTKSSRHLCDGAFFVGEYPTSPRLRGVADILMQASPVTMGWQKYPFLLSTKRYGKSINQ